MGILIFVKIVTVGLAFFAHWTSGHAV